MNKAKVLKRWSRKLITTGHSLTCSIPADLVKEWQLSAGEELVMYQLGDLLLICPLSRILVKGQPREISQLIESLT